MRSVLKTGSDQSAELKDDEKDDRLPPVEGHNASKGTGGVGPDSQGVSLLQVAPAGHPTGVGVLHYDAGGLREVAHCCVGCVTVQVVVVRHLHEHSDIEGLQKNRLVLKLQGMLQDPLPHNRASKVLQRRCTCLHVQAHRDRQAGRQAGSSQENACLCMAVSLFPHESIKSNLLAQHAG